MKPPTVDELMVKVRHEMMKQFNASISTLKQSIDKKIVAAFESGVKALGIQHHADDLITSTTLLHLKYCEIRPDANSLPIHLPSVSFQKNYHWLEATADTDIAVECFKGTHVTPPTYGRKVPTSRPGPLVWPLSMMLQQASASVSAYNCSHHMGFGSASHVSGSLNPVLHWLKGGGSMKHHFQPFLTSELINAGKARAITPELISADTIRPWCLFQKGWNNHHQNNRKNPPSHDPDPLFPRMSPEHVSTFTTEIQELVNMSVPRMVRHPVLLI